MGHVYFPTGLFSASAQLRSAGAEVEIADENLGPIDLNSDVVGVSVIGPPYVGAAQKICRQLSASGAKSVLVGGQGVRGFSQAEFGSLFGDLAVSSWDEAGLLKAVGSKPHELAHPRNISLVGELERLGDDKFKLYFSHEFSLYLSQGCRFSCTFCSAVRSFRDPVSGTITAVREEYRQPELVVQDLRYILSRADSLKIEHVDIYLSNLDLFQSPGELEKFVNAAEPVIRTSNIRVNLRALATTQSFLLLHRSNPRLIERLRALGLHRVGFGIDGATPEVWRGIRKPQSSDSCLAAVQLAAEVYKITPEVLMVFGHEGHDDSASLSLAVETTKRLVTEFRAIPRPHVAKGIIPGNDGWSDPNNRAVVDFLISRPDAFQMLDYTCLPSWLTHKDEAFRQAVTEAFLEICQLPRTLTQYVKPEDPLLPDDQLAETRLFNQGKYDI